MRIAAAQTKPFRANTNANIEAHCKLVDLANQHGVKFLLFPEMSLTGYERGMAQSLAFYTDDERLNPIRTLAVAFGMVIVVGAPIAIESKLYIGSFILHPDGTLAIYTKQFLHPGEELFFTASSEFNPIIEVGEHRISLAICADTSHPEHPANAKKSGATLYAASVFFYPDEMDENPLIGDYAKTHSINVLMANYCGESWGKEAGGRSGYWNSTGERVGELTTDKEALFIVGDSTAPWRAWTAQNIIVDPDGTSHF